MKPEYRRALLIGIVTAVVGILVGHPSSLMRGVEHGWLLKVRGEIEPPPEVVVVSLNSDAAEVLGQSRELSQWSRHKHAELVDELVRRGASVIAFDAFFIEPGDPEDNALLAGAIKNSGQVVLAQELEEINFGEGAKVSQPVPLVKNIADAARGIGPSPMKLRGIRDQFWLFKAETEKKDEINVRLPTFPAVVFQVYALHLVDDVFNLLDQAGFQIEGLAENAMEISDARKLREYMMLLHSQFRNNPRIPQRLLSLLKTGNSGRLPSADRRLLRSLVLLYGGEKSYYYNLYGPLETIRTIRYDKILAGVDRDQNGNRIDLRGKVVFVGASERSVPNQVDRHYTVFTTDEGIDLTGVELAATAFGNLLSGVMLQRNIPASFFALLLFGLLAGGLATLAPGMRAVAATLVLTAVYFGLAVYLFSSHTFWISLSTQVLVQAPAGLFMGLFCQYWCASKEKERLIQWVPPKIADIPETGLFFGTCLFTDIRGSRKLSGRLSVQEYKSLMDRYYDAIKQPVIENGGRVIDFYGDGMMCLFTSKKPETGLRLRAGVTAMEILKKSELFARQEPERRRLKSGIALHSGWMELGGSQLGDVGNTVASIEELNKLLSTKVLASHFVIEGFRKSLSDEGLVEDKQGTFFVRRIGSFMLPGKSEPTAVFELMDAQKGTTGENQAGCDIPGLLKLYSDAMGEFEKERWQEAVKKYEKLLALCPNDGPAQFFMRKCREYCSRQPLPGEAAFIRIGPED